MAQAEHLHALGAEERKSARDYYWRTALVSLLLILFHLLGFQPSEIDSGWLKFEFTNPVVVYGGMGIVVLHFLYRAVSANLIAGAFYEVEEHKPILRSMIKVSRATHDAPADVKREVRIKQWALLLFTIPHSLSSMVIIVAGVILSVQDVYRLCQHAFKVGFG